MTEKEQHAQMSQQDAQAAQDPNNPAHPNHPHVSQYCDSLEYENQHVLMVTAW